MILNLFDRMKLPFRKNKEFLKALYDILGFYPHNIEIYRIAFSHKSLSYRRDAAPKDRKGSKDKRPKTENTAKPLNNERLEYLGDAVLETVVSDILFRHFEHKREGFLTSTRSKIVQREALNRLAEQMGLENLILAAQGTRMSHTNIGGNAFEALMGAIYLDRGYKFCHWFITHRVIGPYVDLDSVAQKEVNFKSKLLEWCQKNRINTNFRDFTNNDGEKGFRSTIVLEGITVGKGSGRSKKESQQLAAKDALLRMRREQKLYDSIFRAKEKRTAMEADESFALPKLDEIESVVKRDRGGKKPVLESERDDEQDSNPTDAAYDAAYNEEAKFEVIAGNADTESEYSEYATDIQPDDAANEPAADAPLTYTPAERPEPMTKAQRKRERNRTAKTVGDAVKSTNKERTSTDEPADSRKAKAEKAEQRKAEKPEKAEKPAKAEKAEKDVKAEKAEQRKANKPEASAEKPANRKAKEEKAANEAPAEAEKANQAQQVKATEEKTLTAAERNAARKARRERRLAESAASASETSLANDGQEAPAEDEPLITLQATITEMVEESPAQQTEETEVGQVISQVITEADEEPLQAETPQPQTADEPQPSTSDETVAEEEAEGTNEEAAASPAATADNRPALQAVLSELMERHAPSQTTFEAPADEPKPEEAAAESPVATEHAEAEAHSEEAETETQEAESTIPANDAEAEAASDEDAEAEGSDNENEGANEEEEAYEKAEDEEENPDEEDSDEEDSDEEDSDEESLDEETEEFSEAASGEDAAEAAVLAQSASSATRPILRHLTLDDFVFGATDGTSHEAPLSSESADDEEEALTDTAAPRRKRKPRRRNRRPKEAEANEASAASQAPSDDRNTDRPAKNGHRAGQQPKPKGQQKGKQKPEAKQQPDPTKEERERAAKRRAAQRRRRRHSAGNELPPQGFDD